MKRASAVETFQIKLLFKKQQKKKTFMAALYDSKKYYFKPGTEDNLQQ